MKILITNGHLNVGGVEKSLINLLRSIDYTKHQVDLLLFEGLGEYQEQVPAEVNIILCDLHSTYGSFVKVLKDSIGRKDFRTIVFKIILTLSNKVSNRFVGLFKYLKIAQKEYDCAIAYRIGFCTEFVAYAIKSKNKCMWWHHGEFDYDDNTVNRWKKYLREIDKIVCVSKSSKELIKPHFPEKCANMTVISNMIIRDEIYQKALKFYPYKEIEKSKVVLVSVGRFSPEKHMPDAVYAMKKLIEKGCNNLLWYLVGDGVEREKVELLIRNYGLEKYFVLVGNQENPYPYVKDADIYVHLSHVESQGIAVLEAMVLEKVCVVTKSTGIEEFVVDGVNAFVAKQTLIV